MNKGLENIFAMTECPSGDTLKQYFGQVLSRSEMYRIERHLVDCEMCSDELEGMFLLETPEKLLTIIPTINSHIDNFPDHRKEKKIIVFDFKWKIAAAIAVLMIITSILLLFKFMDKDDHGKMALHRTEQTLKKKGANEETLKAADKQLEEKDAVNETVVTVSDTGSLEKPCKEIDRKFRGEGQLAEVEVTSFGGGKMSAPKGTDQTYSFSTIITDNEALHDVDDNRESAIEIADIQVETLNAEQIGNYQSVSSNITKPKAEHLALAKTEELPVTPADNRWDESKTGEGTDGKKQKDVSQPNNAITETSTVSRTENKTDKEKSRNRNVKTVDEQPEKDAVAGLSIDSDKNRGKKNREKQSDISPASISRKIDQVEVAAVDDISGTAVPERSESEAGGYLARAVEYYKANDMDSAAANMESYLELEPDNEKGIYYAAMIEMKKGNTTKAIDYFSRLSSNPKGQYYENVLWFMSQCYEKEMNKEKLKESLQKVVLVGGEHKVKAEKKLGEIDD